MDQLYDGFCGFSVILETTGKTEIGRIIKGPVSFHLLYRCYLGSLPGDWHKTLLKAQANNWFCKETISLCIKIAGMLSVPVALLESHLKMINMTSSSLKGSIEKGARQLSVRRRYASGVLVQIQVGIKQKCS